MKISDGNHLNLNIKAISEKKDGEIVKVIGIIKTIKFLKDRRGYDMAFCLIEDQEDSIEMAIFPNLFSSCNKHLDSTKKMVVEAEVLRNESGRKLVAKKITPIDD